MTQWIPVVVSVSALVLSIVTAWISFFRKGRLVMTQPTVVFFGPGRGPGGPGKIFLRTLLYSTSRRGHVVESMHARLERGETKQNFSIWVYGEDQLVRGSGLYVGYQGVAHNHHFWLPPDGATFPFLAGEYCLRVFAKTVGASASTQLAQVRLVVSTEHADVLKDGEAGIFFDWGPDQQKYYALTEASPRGNTPDTFPLNTLESAMRARSPSESDTS